jgi:hypothetical protein
MISQLARFKKRHLDIKNQEEKEVDEAFDDTDDGDIHDVPPDGDCSSNEDDSSEEEDLGVDMDSSDSEDEPEQDENFVEVTDHIFHSSNAEHRDTGCPEDFLRGHDCSNPVPSIRSLILHLMEVHKEAGSHIGLPSSEVAVPVNSTTAIADQCNNRLLKMLNDLPSAVESSSRSSGLNLNFSAFKEFGAKRMRELGRTVALIIMLILEAIDPEDPQRVLNLAVNSNDSFRRLIDAACSAPPPSKHETFREFLDKILPVFSSAFLLIFLITSTRLLFNLDFSNLSQKDDSAPISSRRSALATAFDWDALLTSGTFLEKLLAKVVLSARNSYSTLVRKHLTGIWFRALLCFLRVY